MDRHDLIALVAAAALSSVSGGALAQSAQFGTAAQAKAMLTKAIAAVKADKVKALDMFNKGAGGFLDRDIFPFCFNLSDGVMVATQTKQTMGTDLRTYKDPTGKAFGLAIYAGGSKAEGQVTEVSYMYPKPGPDMTPVPKVSFVTRVADLGCAVGYYK
jgi:hypothetical protein